MHHYCYYYYSGRRLVSAVTRRQTRPSVYDARATHCVRMTLNTCAILTPSPPPRGSALPRKSVLVSNIKVTTAFPRPSMALLVYHLFDAVFDREFAR